MLIAIQYTSTCVPTYMYVSLHEQDGATALYMASQEGHVAVVELLLQEYADVSICEEV